MRKPFSKTSANGSKTNTSALRDLKKPIDRLEELLEDDDAWEEDSRISIEQLHIGHPPQHYSPSNWPQKRRLAGVSGAIVIGMLAALKAGYEMGLLDWFF